MGIAEILDGILKTSLKYHINIEVIQYKSKDVTYAAHIKEREYVVISGDAPFKSIVQLINYIDSINALLQIRDISVNISEDDNITTNFKLKISHYGVEI
jgi:tripartite-type tricarboxylate transporter receptor subunit TctC